MRRVMLDLETYATDSDAMILSIGAVKFDEDLPQVICGEFYTPVAQAYQKEKWGRVVDPRTVQWWKEQGEQARQVLDDSGEHGMAPMLDQALLKFTFWLGGEALEIWGNGSDFDNIILGSAYEATSLSRPWSHGKNRCFRTLKNLGIPLESKDGVERSCHHHALDDARYQAHYAAAWLRKLKEKFG